MSSISKSQCTQHGWLDSLAISMSVICAIHCLLTPVLIVLFPILTTTFWVHKDFHLWMLLFVLPITSFAVFLGCRKHRDKLVLTLGAFGLGCLFLVSAYESFFHFNQTLLHSDVCPKCADGTLRAHFSITTFANILGGLLLASAHIRNFFLCRRLQCTHD